MTTEEKRRLKRKHNKSPRHKKGSSKKEVGGLRDKERTARVTRMETPRMGLSDGNPSYGSVTCYITSQLRLGRPPNRSPICRGAHVYVSTHVHARVHCMRVCGGTG